jgi:hypothetical protein
LLTETTSWAWFHPSIFTNLEPKTEPTDVKEKITDGGLLATEFDSVRLPRRPSTEPPRLIVKPRARQVTLQRNPDNRPVDQERGPIVDGPPHFNRQTDSNDHSPCVWEDLTQYLLG